MLNKAILVLILCLPLLVRAESGPESPANLASLLEMDLAALATIQIFSASRELTDIELAPASVTVITADDIKRRGNKTLFEVLGQATGFFNGMTAAWGTLSNRGVFEDNNGNYLLLVDGHSMTNYAYSPGMTDYYRFPVLGKIERIEIIRGGGSTLWGSDAAMAVINLITKDGSAVDEGEKKLGSLQLKYDREFEHQRDIVDLVYGKKFNDESDFIVTGTYTDSDAPWTQGYLAGPDGYFQPPWQWFTMNMWDYKPSYDLFGKFRNGDLIVEGTYSFLANMQPFATPISGATVGFVEHVQKWMEVKYAPALSDTLLLSSRIYYNDYLDKLRITTTGTRAESVEKVSSKGFGAETILTYRPDDDWNIKLGLFAEHMKLESFSADSIKKIDRNYAIFGETTYSGIKDLSLIAGMRWAKNNGLDNNAAWLPRFAAIYQLTPDWTLKYAHSTGFVRPSLAQAPEGLRFNPTKNAFVKQNPEPQETRSNDFIVMYQKDLTTASLTFFMQNLSELSSFVGTKVGTLNGFDVILGSTNFGKLDTYGFELDFRHGINDKLSIYGNGAFNEAEWSERFPLPGFDIVTDTNVSTDDLRPTGTPKYIWNFGIDYDVREDLLLNLHYRGWHDIETKRTTAPTFDIIGPEHFVDVTLNYKATDTLSFSAYAKNLFNNENNVPHFHSGFIKQPLGLQFGLNFNVSF
jgi:outer membrane receptor protein involved in Fe transport